MIQTQAGGEPADFSSGRQLSFALRSETRPHHKFYDLRNSSVIHFCFLTACHLHIFFINRTISSKYWCHSFVILTAIVTNLLPAIVTAFAGEGRREPPSLLRVPFQPNVVGSGVGAGPDFYEGGTGDALARPPPRCVKHSAN